jgi:hypothetical protein
VRTDANARPDSTSWGSLVRAQYRPSKHLQKWRLRCRMRRGCWLDGNAWASIGRGITTLSKLVACGCWPRVLLAERADHDRERDPSVSGGRTSAWGTGATGEPQRPEHLQQRHPPPRTKRARAAEAQQTLEIAPTQSCANQAPGGSQTLINRAIPRPSSSIVVTLEPACHAGGRGFESRRSRFFCSA